MILKRLVVQNFGPFALPTHIEVEPDITIITGQNDVGKSSLLRLIELVCNGNNLNQDDVNVDRIQDSALPWQDDEEINCICTFEVDENYRKYLRKYNPELESGSEVDYKFFLAPNKKGNTSPIGARNSDGTNRPHNGVLAKTPNVLSLPLVNEMGSTINFRELNQLEKDFLLLTFGQNSSIKLGNLNGINLTREIRKAAERFTIKAKEVLPPSLGFEFVFDRLSGSENLQLIIGLRDRFEGDTALHLRGSGIRKIVTLLTALLLHSNPEENTIILFDEPENSLHANSQHLLRAFLEELAKNQKIQVIYATHSPSMINPMYPQKIRLLERTHREGKATTQVTNNPLESNFLPVRSSLGVTPSDSLLYAPITIIVEGATEILGIPLLLKKFFDSGVEGFEQVDRIFALSHLLDGHGASFEYWCRVAKSQGCKPIIFLDNDRERQVRQQRIPEKHPDVPLIILEDHSEFEDVVPSEIYFQALAVGLENQDLTKENFDTWVNDAKLPESMAFSKKVDRWLQSLDGNIRYDKPDVMKRAIEIVELEDVKKEPFVKLVHAILSLLRNAH